MAAKELLFDEAARRALERGANAGRGVLVRQVRQGQCPGLALGGDNQQSHAAQGQAMKLAALHVGAPSR